MSERINGLQEPESTISKLATGVAILFIFFPIYLVFQAIGSCRWNEVKTQLDQEHVDVLVLRESTDELDERIVAACKGLWDERKPVVKLDSPETESFGASSRQWFAVDRARYRGAGVAPAFIERMSWDQASKKWKTEPYFNVIYAAFTSFNQAWAWLRTNGYSESDFQLGFPEVEPEFFDKSSVELSTVRPKLGESVIQFQGVFRTTGQTWLWNGQAAEEIGPDMVDFTKAVQKVAR